VATRGGRLGGRGANDAPTTARRLVRSADQVDILVELFDAEVSGDQVTPTGPDPALRLTFGSQHTAERNFVDPAPVPPINGVSHIAAGPSVVVAPVTAAFPFTVDGVLGVAEAATTRRSPSQTTRSPSGSSPTCRWRPRARTARSSS
jgi:hypothetical protein